MREGMQNNLYLATLRNADAATERAKGYDEQHG